MDTFFFFNPNTIQNLPLVQEETRRRALKDADYLQGVLLEVQRLWPPFIGGRRIAERVRITYGLP